MAFFYFLFFFSLVLGALGSPFSLLIFIASFLLLFFLSGEAGGWKKGVCVGLGESRTILVTRKQKGATRDWALAKEIGATAVSTSRKGGRTSRRDIE